MLNGLYGYIFGGGEQQQQQQPAANEVAGADAQGAQSQDDSKRVTAVSRGTGVVTTPQAHKAGKRQLHDETIDDEWILVDDKHPGSNPHHPHYSNSGRSSPVLVAEPQIHSADENDDVMSDSATSEAEALQAHGHAARRHDATAVALPLAGVSAAKQVHLSRAGRTLGASMLAGGVEPSSKRANMVVLAAGGGGAHLLKGKNRKAKMRINGHSGKCNDRKCQ